MSPLTAIEPVAASAASRVEGWMSLRTPRQAVRAARRHGVDEAKGAEGPAEAQFFEAGPWLQDAALSDL